MGKLVLFNIVEDDYQSGFHVILQIFTEGDRRLIADTEGRLPPAIEVIESYDSWRKSHRKKVTGRDSARLIVKGSTDRETLAEIKKGKEQLHYSVNNWLNPHQKNFSPIWTEILKTMKDEDEEIRVIVKTKNQKLQHLPWYIWDEFFYYYRRAEVCLYLPVTIRKPATPRDKVKVLAVLGKKESVGNNTRIRTEQDWEMLERHLSQESNAELIRLDEPTLEELCDQIEEQSPQILFFAGHSCSEEDEAVGLIELNQYESITIDDMAPYLREAVDLGLQLAIFNSCEGLGIARQLANLHIPNIIVMGEPVPDEVAQKFLQRFLEAFAAGKPLHVAVREAREKINYLERKFPGATWLPMLFQNPAEAPLTWRWLGGVEIQRQSNLAYQADEQLITENQSSIVSVSSEVDNNSQITPIQQQYTEVRDISKREPHQPLADGKKSFKCDITQPQIGGENQIRLGPCFVIITVMMVLLIKAYGKMLPVKPVYTSKRRPEISLPSQIKDPQATQPYTPPSSSPLVPRLKSTFGDYTFFCRENDVPTTIAKHPLRGESVFIRWVNDSWNHSPLNNCREVSGKLQKAQEKGILNYIVLRTLNNNAVICASRMNYGPCEELLLTLPLGYDPEKIFRQLTSVSDMQAEILAE